MRLVEQAEDCGPGEPFVPTDVDTLLGNDTVALRGPWDTDDLVTIAPSADDLGKGLTGYHLDFPGNPLERRVLLRGVGERADRGLDADHVRPRRHRAGP